MTANRSEHTWGNSLTGTGFDGGAPFNGQKRLVTVTEKYARAWIVRCVLTLSRPLVVAAGDIAFIRATVQEGVGQSSVRWQFTFVAVDGATQAPVVDGSTAPQSFQNPALTVAGSVFTIDAQVVLVAGAGAGDLGGTGSIWIAPMAPVYPPGLGT